MHPLAKIRAYRFTAVHCVFACVLGLRVLTLARLTTSAMLMPARGDMHFYNEWAQRILRGEFTDHLAFYGLPLYAYLLALIYRVFGYGPFLPGLFQAVLDAGTAAIIYLLTEWVLAEPRVGSSRSNSSATLPRLAGAMAALGWATFVPAQAYAVVLMPTAWFVFAFWFVVWRLVRNERPPGPIAALGFGLAIGVTAMGVATILFLIPLVFAAFVLKSGRSRENRPGSGWPKTALSAALLVTGLVAGTAPCWIHNYVIARDPVVLSAHGGINFWIGNNPDANGYPKFPPGLRAGQAAMLEDSINAAQTAAGRKLKRAEVSAFWSAKAKQFIRTHFSDWLRLLIRKLANFWSAFQYDDLSVVTTLREHSVIPPGIYFGLVAAFAIPGMILGYRFYPRSRWVSAAVLLHMCALLPVFVTERYRLAAVPGLLVLAAVGLTAFWQSIALFRWQKIAVYVSLLLASTAFVAWPRQASSLWALDAYNSGWQALQSDDLALAERKLSVARAYVPDNPETDFAFGNLRLAQGRPDEAAGFYRETLRIDRHHKGALNNLGVVALDKGDLPAARLYLEAALTQDRGNAKTHYLLAKTALAEGNIPAATALVDRAIALGGERPEFTDLRDRIRKRP